MYDYEIKYAYWSYMNFDQSKFYYDQYVITEIVSSVHNNVDTCICTRTFCEYLVTVIDLHCPL